MTKYIYFVEIFLDSYKKAPKQIILDMDVTDDQVHGLQDGLNLKVMYSHRLSASRRGSSRSRR